MAKHDLHVVIARAATLAGIGQSDSTIALSELEKRLNQFAPHDGTRWSEGVKLYALELARKAAGNATEIPALHLTESYLLDGVANWHEYSTRDKALIDSPLIIDRLRNEHERAALALPLTPKITSEEMALAFQSIALSEAWEVVNKTATQIRAWQSDRVPVCNITDIKEAIGLSNTNDWYSGLCDYALEFANYVEAHANNDGGVPASRLTETFILDGARNWKDYDYQGKSLTDIDAILERCQDRELQANIQQFASNNPSEIHRVQACFLSSAWCVFERACEKAMRVNR